ncbi:MAG: hypothetical protein ACREDL_07380, partial [Bradyrhizobium sp.]
MALSARTDVAITPAARFIRLAARTAAFGSSVGARVGIRAEEVLTAGRKMSARAPRPRSTAPGVTAAVAFRVIGCPYAERKLAASTSTKPAVGRHCAIGSRELWTSLCWLAFTAVPVPVRPMHQLFPLGNMPARTCLKLPFNTLP